MSKTRRRKPKSPMCHSRGDDGATYETTLNGKKTRVTIPENQRDEDTLGVLKDNLSPEAVAAIVAYLVARPTAAPNAKVNRELNWFTDGLVDLIGGDEAFNRLCEELGL